MKHQPISFGEYVLGAILITFAAIGLLLATSGCATTRISVTTPAGVKVRASFPKNMDASGLVVRVGDYSLTADRITTDASSVVREKNKGVSAVAGAASDVAKAVSVTTISP